MNGPYAPVVVPSNMSTCTFQQFLNSITSSHFARCRPPFKRLLSPPKPPRANGIHMHDQGERRRDPLRKRHSMEPFNPRSEDTTFLWAASKLRGMSRPTNRLRRTWMSRQMLESLRQPQSTSTLRSSHQSRTKPPTFHSSFLGSRSHRSTIDPSALEDSPTS
jgi:hypothetical protein